MTKVKIFIERTMIIFYWIITILIAKKLNKIIINCRTFGLCEEFYIAFLTLKCKYQIQVY